MLILVHVKTPCCGEEFKLDVQDRLGTIDCETCGTELIFVKMELRRMHEYLHEQDSRWPKDGRGTAYIEI